MEAQEQGARGTETAGGGMALRQAEGDIMGKLLSAIPRTGPDAEDLVTVFYDSRSGTYVDVETGQQYRLRTKKA